MKPRKLMVPVVIVVSAFAWSCPRAARAQSFPGDGRVSLTVGWAQRDQDGGGTSDFTEVIANISLDSPSGDPSSLFEYSLDARFATFPSAERETRVSIYEAFIGVHSRSNRWSLRLGQVWIKELGGLGSVAGFQGEFRIVEPTAIGSLRFGLFGGLEPLPYEADFAEDVRKGGAYVAVDGAKGRRHVLGYVTVRNSGLTERAVVVFNNFLPISRTFSLYQALEYDTTGPADVGGAEMTYFFANLRFSPTRLLDLQATYHRGLSVDTRAITRDRLDDRPVSVDALNGLLFESGRFRATVRPSRHASIWASVGQDRNNRGEDPRDRLEFGVSGRRLFSSRFDLTVAGSRYTQEQDSYDTFRASIGCSVGTRSYVSLDFYDSFAVYHTNDGAGGTIEVRPNSNRVVLSSNTTLSRSLSLYLSAEMLDSDSYSENRVMSTLVVRF